MASNKPRTDGKPHMGVVTQSDLKSGLKSATGIDVDAAAKKVDTNGDGKVSKQENVAAAKKLAEQFDREYGDMRLKGFSRQEVNRQLGSIASNGKSGGALAGSVAYEVGKADSNSDGTISSSEAKNYVDAKTGISEKVMYVENKVDSQRTKLSQAYGSSDDKSRSNRISASA